MVLCLPDFERHAEKFQPGVKRVVQVSAFAHEITCYPDEAAFERLQDWEPRLAPYGYIPSGVFGPDADTNPQPTAIFAGKIERYELIRNLFSGKSFHHLVVKSLPGTFDIVAEKDLLQETPMVGGIAYGSFWLSGRLLDE